MSVRVITGDCRAVLPTLPAVSVHCVVTSPPYWGLRDFGIDGQLGLEPTPELYVEHIVAVFREVRRVLEHLGYPVTRLIRLAYGPFQLGHLARGSVEEVSRSVLADQLGSAEPKPGARRRR